MLLIQRKRLRDRCSANLCILSNSLGEFRQVGLMSDALHLWVLHASLEEEYCGGK
jgi:hypothetical protein